MGIHVYGFHGVFDFEQEKGQDFYIDLKLDLDLIKSAESDCLGDTIDYGAVTNTVVEVTAGPPFALIEKLAGQIAGRLLFEFGQLQSVTVTVHKPQAPVGHECLDISVVVKRSRIAL